MTSSNQTQSDRFSSGAFFWGCWYVVSLVLMLLVPSAFRLREHLWNLPPDETSQSFAIGMGYLAFSLFFRLIGTRLGRVGGFVALAGGSMFCFVLPWFVLSRWGVPASRTVFLSGAILGIVLSVIPFILGRYRAVGLVVVLAGVFGTAMLDFRKNEPESVIRGTAFYALSMTSHPGLIPQPRERVTSGGAIAKYGDGFLLVTSIGEFYRLSWDSKGDGLKSLRLSLGAPFNREEFVHDQERPDTATMFRIADMVVDERSSPAKVYLAHHHWNHDEHCITMRVSKATLVEPPAKELEEPTVWETIFESKPCLSLGITPPRIDTNEGGGGLVLHPRGLLLSIGDNGIEGLDGEAPFSQNMDVSYGKVLLLDMMGSSKIFSIGHRNPTGLTVDEEGRIWETEHGPQGGDELNLITEGGNYGWPLATYGTQYGMNYWPLAPKSRNHGSFIEPAQAFVPALGISRLITLGPETFPMWNGDLLVASLRRQTLYRVRLTGDRVVYVEPIPNINARIRDLAQGRDGRILLWTDSGEIISLSPAPPNLSGEAIFATYCSGCHEAPPGGTNSAAPSLRGVVGRPVASEKDYPYSISLRQLGGRWTEERLNDFVKDPAILAPGTTMEIGGVQDPDQRKALIQFMSEEYK